ncbi:MAG TPA: hypothetical protein VFI25_07920 [Planctomycetota bacterium]|jgi:hypothetical protein|nr:hypothetical protein [Planctomycetota bacterium]
MKKKWGRLVVGGLLVAAPSAFLVFLLGSVGKPVEDPALAFAHLRSAPRVGAAYESWKEARRTQGGERRLALRLGWSKAYSSAFTRATGDAAIDLDAGTIRVEVHDLENPEAHEVWLVENAPGPGRSARPEPGDRTLRAGALAPRKGKGVLEAELGAALGGFRVDEVVVTRAGEEPTRSGLLFGSPSLFQRMQAWDRAGREPSGGAYGEGAGSYDLDRLVAKGADLFFRETFGGNGRTCGTCHPAGNNFTIDPKFIAGLPPNDPLFVAEFEPALSRNFEKPELMRRVGLILENVDGFDDLEHRFVMRGVPHTLAMRTSIAAPPPAPDAPTAPPSEQTGWSGDGAPGGGTLREFANGAIRQHFTKTLKREPGVDFRFATEEELDALEAFQLSLGRDADPEDVTAVRFRSRLVARGRDIFVADDAEGATGTAGKCDVCHANAGATVEFVAGGLNFNFDTGVENLPDHPADLAEPGSRPRDGGFGKDPNPAGGFGDGTFNTPPLIEAADTGPFFHNDAIQTLEEAVAFYNSAAFNESPAGKNLADPETGIAIRLDPTQVVAVASFLRVMNSLENIRQATEFAEGAKAAAHPRAARALLRLATEEAGDAGDVLDCAGLHPTAVRALRKAGELLRKASVTCWGWGRAARIRTALQALERAQADMVEGPSPFARSGPSKAD